MFSRIVKISIQFVTGFVLLIFSNCSHTDSSTDTTLNHSIPVTTLKTQTAELHRNYIGSIDALQNIELRARVQGYLEHIFVDEGKEVLKGQVLFQLSDKEYKAELAKTESELKTAIAEAAASEHELKRIAKLVEKGVVSGSELDVAQARFDAINAGIEKARSAKANAATRLSYTNIRAPFDGVIDRIPFKVGSLINEGALLTTVSNLQQVYAYFNVSEVDYLEYMKTKLNDAKGASSEVELILADGSSYPHAGKVETMDGEFKENTGSIAFRAKFPNPQKILKHGSTGTVQLTNLVPHALMVPQKATFEIQDKCYVYVVNNKNEVKMRSFVPASRVSDFYIVKSGLSKGERVVYEGVQKMKDGMKITPKNMLSGNELVYLEQ